MKNMKTLVDAAPVETNTLHDSQPITDRFMSPQDNDTLIATGSDTTKSVQLYDLMLDADESMSTQDRERAHRYGRAIIARYFNPTNEEAGVDTAASKEVVNYDAFMSRAATAACYLIARDTVEQYLKSGVDDEIARQHALDMIALAHQIHTHSLEHHTLDENSHELADEWTIEQSWYDEITALEQRLLGTDSKTITYRDETHTRLLRRSIKTLLDMYGTTGHWPSAYAARTAIPPEIFSELYDSAGGYHGPHSLD